MAHAFSFRLGRFIFPIRLVAHPVPEERQLLEIEIERLPDYRWRELGFPQPARKRRE